MTRHPRRGVIAALVLALTVTGSLTALAGGSQDVCRYKPWRCATTTTVETTTTTEATTTTTEPETTTTVPDTTTTTEATTTTTEPETTTTVEDLRPAGWTAVAFCQDGQADYNGAITVSFDPAEILRVDAVWEDPIFGDNPVDSFTEPGTKAAAVGFASTFRLTPVAQAGFTPDPAELVVTVEACPRVSPSSTEAPDPTVAPTTTAPTTTPDTLPFTGPAASVGLWALGAALIGGGLALTMLKREGDE